jgi:hypothetical protein
MTFPCACPRVSWTKRQRHSAPASALGPRARPPLAGFTIRTTCSKGSTSTRKWSVSRHSAMRSTSCRRQCAKGPWSTTSFRLGAFFQTLTHLCNVQTATRRCIYSLPPSSQLDTGHVRAAGDQGASHVQRSRTPSASLRLRPQTKSRSGASGATSARRLRNQSRGRRLLNRLQRRGRRRGRSLPVDGHTKGCGGMGLRRANHLFENFGNDAAHATAA